MRSGRNIARTSVQNNGHYIGIRKIYDSGLEHRDIRVENVLSTDPSGDCGELATKQSRTTIEREVCPEIAVRTLQPRDLT